MEMVDRDGDGDGGIAYRNEKTASKNDISPSPLSSCLCSVISAGSGGSSGALSSGLEPQSS